MPAVLVLVGVLMLAFLVLDEPFSRSFYLHKRIDSLGILQGKLEPSVI